MTWTRHALVAHFAEGNTVDFLFFWGHTPKAPPAVDASCLSQWFPAAFEVDGVAYKTAEHFMMAEKARLFGDDATRARILAAHHPAEAKKLGREVRGFDEERWQAARFELVTQGNLAKFGQDDALRAYLLSTGATVLVEASPTDTVWGIGLAANDPAASEPAEWRGLNLLGFALMRARAILRGELDSL